MAKDDYLPKDGPLRVTDDIDIVMPSDNDSEVGLLGSIVCDPSILSDVRCRISREQFWTKTAQAVFQAMLDLVEGGKPITAVTLNTAIPENLEYMTALCDIPSAASWESYADNVGEMFRRRSAIATGRRLMLEASNGTGAAQAAATALRALEGLDCPQGGIGRAEIRLASEIEPETITWLWAGRFPAGKLSMIYGAPGLGKSLLSTDMAATISRGMPWPDGAPCEQGDVLILSGEDEADDTIIPRLIAANADLGRVHIMDGMLGRDPKTGERVINLPILTENMGDIRKAIERTQARMMIIDPVSCFLGTVDEHRNAELRGMLSPLKQVASDTGCAIVLMTHARKSGGSGVDAALGSVAQVAAMRVVWLVAKDPEDAEARLILLVKSNLAKHMEGLRFNIETAPENFAPKVAWCSGAVSITADEVLRCGDVGRIGRPSAECDEAVDWLDNALAGGPRPSKDLIKSAKAAGITERTLIRAKAKLGVKAVPGGGFQGKWSWRLKEA